MQRAIVGSQEYGVSLSAANATCVLAVECFPYRLKFKEAAISRYNIHKVVIKRLVVHLK